MSDQVFKNFKNSDAVPLDSIATVDILLATFNSGKYLAENIESIINQDFVQWRLLIRDDLSQDNTLDIIKHYTRRYPDKIVHILSQTHCNACKSYSELMLQSSAPYVMFCDHDDIWLPEKISKSLVRMKQAESEYGMSRPLLIFTDKRVVDQNLNIIGNSYFKHQNLNPANTTLHRLLVQNIPSGCTGLMNRTLVKMCTTIPPAAVMHDHWISLVAAAFGYICYLNEPTILYRQHDQNIFGSSKYGWEYIFQCCKKGIDLAKERFYQNVIQASAFYEYYKKDLNPEQNKVLQEFSNLKNISWINRREVLLRNRILKTGLRRNLGMLLII